MTTDAPALAPALQTAAADVVGEFLQHLRRRDLDALAALLRADAEVLVPPVAPGTGTGPRPAGPGADPARDGAQLLLRSFGGTGLVESAQFASTDGQTVFVEFHSDHQDGTGRFGPTNGVRLLRFAVSGGAIARIWEYTGPVAGDAGRTRVGSDQQRAGGPSWPSLGADRPVEGGAPGR